jgi:hypothetical protein
MTRVSCGKGAPKLPPPDPQALARLKGRFASTEPPFDTARRVDELLQLKLALPPRP